MRNRSGWAIIARTSAHEPGEEVREGRRGAHGEETVWRPGLARIPDTPRNNAQTSSADSTPAPLARELEDGRCCPPWKKMKTHTTQLMGSAWSARVRTEGGQLLPRWGQDTVSPKPPHRPKAPLL